MVDRDSLQLAKKKLLGGHTGRPTLRGRRGHGHGHGLAIAAARHASRFQKHVRPLALARLPRCSLSGELRALLLQTGDSKELGKFLPYLTGVDARAEGLFTAMQACKKSLGETRSQLFSECGEKFC